MILLGMVNLTLLIRVHMSVKLLHPAVNGITDFMLAPVVCKDTCGEC